MRPALADWYHLVVYFNKEKWGKTTTNGMWLSELWVVWFTLADLPTKCSCNNNSTKLSTGSL